MFNNTINYSSYEDIISTGQVILILVNMFVSFQSKGQDGNTKMRRAAFLSIKMVMDQYSSIIGRIGINFEGSNRITAMPL